MRVINEELLDDDGAKADAWQRRTSATSPIRRLRWPVVMGHQLLPRRQPPPLAGTGYIRRKLCAPAGTWENQARNHPISSSPGLTSFVELRVPLTHFRG